MIALLFLVTLLYCKHLPYITEISVCLLTALRYTTSDGESKESAARLTNHLVNVKLVQFMLFFILKWLNINTMYILKKLFKKISKYLLVKLNWNGKYSLLI